MPYVPVCTSEHILSFENKIKMMTCFYIFNIASYAGAGCNCTMFKIMNFTRFVCMFIWTELKAKSIHLLSDNHDKWYSNHCQTMLIF